MLEKPICITWVPTRKCNLRCPGCRITNPSDNDVGNELSIEMMDKVIDWFKTELPDNFVCVLGGDVSVWPKDRLLSFIRSVSKVFNGITTNGLMIDRKLFDEMIQAGLNNLTVSANPCCQAQHSTSYLKRTKAFELIKWQREVGINDLHCTVTLDRMNFENAHIFVQQLTDAGCYAEITPFISKRNNSSYLLGEYNEIMTFGDDYTRRLSDVMEKIIEKKHEGCLVHNTDWYLRNFSKFGISLGWKCNEMFNLVVDADGYLLPCFELKGIETRKIHVLEIGSKYTWNDVFLAYKKDQELLCQGCYWNCQAEAEYIYNKTSSREVVLKWFAHGVKEIEGKYQL